MTAPVVSVVIPAYNVAPYLATCLQSLLDQTLGFERLQIVLVDDGSTDGTGDLLDEFAVGRPNVTVLHQENSGAPGAPRNRGVTLSTGEFLFFLDPDDYLGAEALERMVDLAERNDSDVVLGKVVGVGRNAPLSPFLRNVDRGDVYSTSAIWSVSAQKLFRRSLVLDHRLRFAEGTRIGEDQEFVVGAYLFAETISVVADYPCYYLLLREDGSNATRTPPDPKQFYGVLERVLMLVTRHSEAGWKRDSLLRRFYTVEFLTPLSGRGFAQLTESASSEYVRLSQPLLRFFSEELVANSPAIHRLRVRLLRHGLVEQLRRLASFEVHETRQPPLVEGGRAYARLPFFREELGIPDGCFDITSELVLDHCVERASMQGGRLRVSWEPFAPALVPDDVDFSLVLRSRRRDVHVEMKAREVAPGRREVDIDLLDAAGGVLPDGRWDVAVRVQRGREQRRKFVGEAATLRGFEAPVTGLLADKAAVLRVNSTGRLVLHVVRRANGLPATVDSINMEEAGPGIMVSGSFPAGGMTDHGSWTGHVVLRHRKSGNSIQVVSTMAPGSDPAGAERADSQWHFRARIVLDPADVLDRGVWDAYLVMRNGPTYVEGRLRAAGGLSLRDSVALAGGVVAIPYLTTAGNMSIDVGPIWRGMTASVELHSLPSPRSSARLQLRGTVKVLPRVHGGTPSGALVLRRRTSQQEIVLPVGWSDADVSVLDVTLDLRQLSSSGRLAPGRWAVALQVCVGPLIAETPVRCAPVASPRPASAVRWWDAARGPLSARPAVDGGELVIEVAGLRYPARLRRGFRVLRKRLAAAGNRVGLLHGRTGGLQTKTSKGRIRR